MHLSFIMDGNRRWAKECGQGSRHGHSAGFAKIQDIVPWCLENSVEYASFWMLAKKNIEHRSPEEIGDIYDILVHEVLPSIVPLFRKLGVRLEIA